METALLLTKVGCALFCMWHLANGYLIAGTDAKIAVHMAKATFFAVLVLQ